MSNQVEIYRPQVGMRFHMRGSEFEVCFAEMGMVRYAAVKGGKPFRFTFARFLELQHEKEVCVDNPEMHGQEKENGVPGLINLTENELSRAMRQLRYAEAAIAELVFPNSIAHLTTWIPTFAQSIVDQLPPCPRAVSYWVAAYLRKGKDAFMAPNRKCGNRNFYFSPEIEMLILEAVDSFLQEERRDSKDVLAYIVGHLAEQNLLTKNNSKTKIPSERTIRRHLKRIDPYILVRLKRGAIAAEKMARAAGKMIVSPRPMHRVEIDTHFLKIYVVDPDSGEVLGMPYLVCAFDVRTRCVVGIYISLLPASTVTTLGVVKDMLTRPLFNLPGGIPVYLIPDNGVEFRNSGVERLMSKLLVHFEPAMERDPNGKAHVESFFRTLSLFLIQKLKGTTFSGEAKNDHYRSQDKAYATIEQIEEYVRFWIENEYHMRTHSMTGRIPIRQWEEETAKSSPQSMTQEEVDAMARRAYRVRINRGRVQVEKQAYYSHALATLQQVYKGSVTVLMNEMDLNDVLVEHPLEKGVLIKADSVYPEYTRGLSIWEHEEAQKIKSKMTEADLKAVGKYASLLARYQLLQKIQKDSKFARNKIAKITQGKGRYSYTNPEDLDFEDTPLSQSELNSDAVSQEAKQQGDFADAPMPDDGHDVNGTQNRAAEDRKTGSDIPKRKNSIYFMGDHDE